MHPASDSFASAYRCHQQTLTLTTHGRGTTNITEQVRELVTASRVYTGTCHCFIQHTSASLILCENADPTVRRDLEAFLARLVPDGDRLFEHNDEGPDDMPAHVRSILTKTDLTLPVSEGRCALGTWQGLYLYEHRTHAHRRRVTVTVQGVGEAGGR
jgi:secondary thiamine-phosphate synthase enzyme